MDRQPTNFPDQLIEAATVQLRADEHVEPTQDFIHRYNNSAAKRERRRMPMPLKIAGAVTLCATVAIWPYGKKSSAWSQVASATRAAERVHIIYTDLPQGRRPSIVAEYWIDGKRWRDLLPIGDGRKFWSETRRNGIFRSSHNTYQPYWSVRRLQPNDRYNPRELMEGFDVKKLLAQRGHESDLLEYKPQTSFKDGKYDYYRVKSGPNSAVRFYSDPQSGKVKYCRTDDSLITFEYPTSIDPEMFDPPKKSPYPIHNIEKEETLLKSTILAGHGIRTVAGSKVNLRLVLNGRGNELTVLWTGTPPNGDMAPAIQVVGNSVSQVYGPTALTSTIYRSQQKLATPAFLNEHVWGMVLVLKNPVGTHVHLKVPVFTQDKTQPIKAPDGNVNGYKSKVVGWADYQEVPITRAAPIQEFRLFLGLTTADLRYR